MRNKKVIVLTNWHFNPRDDERFGHKILASRGFEVEVWDLYKLEFPHLDKPKGQVLPPYWLSIETEEELRSKCSAVKNSFILSTTLMDSTFWIYEVFKQNENLRIFTVLSSHALSVPQRIPLYHQLKFAWSLLALNPRRVYKKIWQTFSRILGSKKDIAERLTDFIDVIVISGSASLETPGYRISPKTKVVLAHSYDFDRILELGATPRIIKEPYVVFLDEYLPLHPDHAAAKDSPPMAPAPYFKKMNRLFALVEKQFDLPVIVAAHPSSAYHETGSPFGGRTTVRFRSPELIRDAELVLAHSSTTLSMVCIFDKPVLLVNSYLWKGRFGWTVELMAKLLGAKMVYLETMRKLPTPLPSLKPDPEKRRIHIGRFIGEMGSKSNAEIIADLIVSEVNLSERS